MATPETYKTGTKKYFFELGQRYGTWTVIGEDFTEIYWSDSGKKKYIRKVPCRCGCGKEQIMFAVELALGRSDKCVQCAGKDRVTVKVPSYIYRCHHNMLKRCDNQSCKDYPNYGGRGIKVCPEWYDVEIFYKDIGPRPSKQHSLDRKNNDLGYTKKNCRWANTTTQQMNRRNTVTIEYQGQTRTLKDWAAYFNIDYRTLGYRVRKGWPIDELFSAPEKRRRV